MIFKRLKLLSQAIENGDDSYTLDNKVYLISSIDYFFSKGCGFFSCILATRISRIIGSNSVVADANEIYEPRIVITLNDIAIAFVSATITVFIVYMVYELYCRIYSKK